MIEQVLERLAERRDLTTAEMEEAVEAVVANRCTETEVAALLAALRVKGETAEELVAAATVLRRHMVRVRSGRTGVVDTCGTGGDGLQTFNISTAAAIVVAAAGVPVAKHGNRGVSSRSGSADVLPGLGGHIEA